MRSSPTSIMFGSLLCCVMHLSFAQSDTGTTSTSDSPHRDITRPMEMSQLAEDLVGTPEDDEAFESSYEAMVQSLSKQINLNRADVDELLSLNVLTNDEAEAIVLYRTLYGDFRSFFELQAVPGLAPDVIRNLRPFITVSEAGSAIDRTLTRRIIHESDNYLLMRFSRAWSSVADKDSLAGSPEHLLLRFRSHRPGDFSFGFNTEKDSGEPIRWDTRHAYFGFDRWTFHAQLQHKGRIKNLVLGDFQAQYGQGLMIGGAFGPGKGSETITAMRRANVGIIPYTSAYESGNMRGAALAISLTKTIELSILCSRTRRDASFTMKDSVKLASSILRSGLHRTDTELEGRRQLTDTQLAAILQRRKGSVEMGVMVARNSYGNSISPKEMPYNQFAFRGRAYTNAGFFVNYHMGRFSTFGEGAAALGYGAGVVGGILGAVTRHLDIALLVRSYAPDFYTRFSNAMSENSVAANEQGAYLGWRYQFSRRFSLTGYLDIFTFPWLRYRAYAPSSGHEWLSRLTFQPSRNALFYFQAREEVKMRNDGATANTYAQATGRKNNYWLHAEVGLRDVIRFRTKLQFSRFWEDDHLSKGISLSQDLRLDLGKVEVIGRYALFDTDNYDNRLYAYENDVLFAYSMPAYNGTGIRKMIMVRVDITRQLTLWARYAETVNKLTDDMSPGHAATGYTTDREVRFQLRIQF